MNFRTVGFSIIIILATFITLVIVLPFISGPNAIVMLFIILIATALSLGIINSRRRVF